MYASSNSAANVWPRVLGRIKAGALLTACALSCLPYCHSAEYVIHISVDGLQPHYLQAAIDGGQAPTFKRLQDEGAWTTNARTDYAYTITLPNHTSMITSRPVEQPMGSANTIQHGYTDNGEPDFSWTLHNQGNLNVAYKASVFDVVHDAGFSTSLYASKSKFAIFDHSYNEVNGADNPHGKDKIDKFFALHEVEPFYSQSMQAELLANLQSNPTRYTFVHYTNTDTAGHTYGWGSEPYNNAIAIVDQCLDEVLDSVAANPLLSGKTAIILSADHGGEGYDHSDPTLAVDYTIPFFIWGAGVGHGDLYSFNDETRTDPGDSRPDYLALGQPIRNGDGGNLALKLLGLGPIPGSLINLAQDLRVTRPGDFNADNAVNAADYVVWRHGLGTTYAESDYNLWRSHFVGGEGGGASATVAVPEPAATTLALSVLLVFGSIRGFR